MVGASPRSKVESLVNGLETEIGDSDSLPREIRGRVRLHRAGPIGIGFQGTGIHGVEIGFPVLLHCFLRILTGGEMPHVREAKSN
jgi:hypothetical protein